MVILALLAASLSTPVLAQESPRCFPHKEFLEMAEKSHYQEIPEYRAMLDGGLMLEILTSPDRSTWTALIVNPNGNACLLIVGEDWQPLVKPEPGEGL